MSKPKRPSLAEMTVADAPAEPAPATVASNVTTLQRDDVTTSKRAKHTSLYLPPDTRRAIQEIAFQFDRKPHDLYIEGINLMLAKYGKPPVSK